MDASDLCDLSLSRLSRPANLTGFPAISLPCGFTQAGLPIGLQLMGRPFGEATLLNLAYAYEQSTTWHTRRPPFKAVNGYSYDFSAT
jgi:Asp-tRNA(Asn)/Glu-tRNA(Gln) amidotransferase A subunit family amidase